MADSFFPSLAGGILGRMFGFGSETSQPSSGGLAAAPAREEIKPITMPESPEAARQDYYNELNNLRRVQSGLLRSLEERAKPNASDTLFAISRGLLAPNPTGQFGVAFGNAVGELQGQQEKQNVAAQQLAKMRLELGQNQLGVAEKGIALAQEQQRIKALSDALGGASGAEVAGAEGVSSDMIRTAFNQLDGPTKAMIRSMPSDKAMQFLLELVKQQVKTPEAVLTAEHWLNALPENVRGIAKQFYANTQVFGPAEARVRAMLEINNAVDEGKLSKEDAQKFTGMLQPTVPAAGAAPSTAPAPSVAPAAAPATSAAPAGKPAAVQPPASSSSMVAPSAPQRPAAVSSTSAEGVMPVAIPASYVRPAAATQPLAAEAPATPSRVLTAATTTGGESTSGLSNKQMREQAAKRQEEARAEARKIQEEGRTAERKRTERLEESQFSDREALKARASRSTEIIQDADTAVRLARTQPGAFGPLSKPGIMNALLTAVESNSRLGFISFSVPEIQKMIIQAGGTQEQLNAMSQLDFIAIKQQLDAAAKAKGSVSNYERGLFGRVTAQPSDSPNVIIWKSNLLKASALFERDVWNAYRQWEKSNRGGLESFKDTEQFKSLENVLKGRVNTINSAFIK